MGDGKVKVEICENESMIRGSWALDPVHPWTTKDLEICSPPEEYALPSAEWSWASNWRIEKAPGCTDADGWEYA